MSNQLRLQILSERQNNRCAYCGFPVWQAGIDTVSVAPPWQVPIWIFRRWCEEELALPLSELRRIVPPFPSALGASHWPAAVEARRATIDHVKPRSRGGRDGWANYVIACQHDNALKGNHTAERAVKIVQRMIDRGTHPHSLYQRTGRFSPVKLPVLLQPEPTG